MREYLMCPPRHFAVRYAINPWMRPDQPVDASRALAQWQRLHDTLVDLGHRVHLVEPHPDLPDMVFAANGGIVIGNRALAPRFRHRERAGEADGFAEAFAALGIPFVRQARFVNEGEGDFRLVGERILAGTGLRSETSAADEAAAYFDRVTIPLTLVDERFYHLDTALAVLDDRTVAYWPGAFDAAGRGTLEQLFPDAILADEEAAAALALNMVSDGANVIMTPGQDRLAARIAERDFEVVQLATDELLKAGGGAKCCVLECHPG